MTWQPIETAPKSGKRILLAEAGSVYEGAWAAIEPAEAGWVWSHQIEDWQIRESGFSNPTHWMPLPEPPQ